MGGPGYGVGARGSPPEHLPEYDDTDAPINEEAYAALIAGGIDEMMARYDLQPYTLQLHHDAVFDCDASKMFQRKDFTVLGLYSRNLAFDWRQACRMDVFTRSASDLPGEA
jgi:hypothetical protein